MRWWAAVMVGAMTAGVRGQGIEVRGARAPEHGIGATARAGLSLKRGDAAWGRAAVRGVPAMDGTLVIPESLPGFPRQLGVHARPPGGPIGAKKSVSVEGRELVWRARVDAPGSEAVRLHLTGLNLGPGSTVLVAGSAGDGYVIQGRGAMGLGEEWTPVLEGDRAYVEWRGPVSAGLPGFVIDEVSQMVLPRPAAGGAADLLPCQVDVQCQSVDATARDSVGWMVYSTPQGTFTCSGALLNDTSPQTTLGWFLTSNLCINTAAAAASVTVYWFYQTPTCNGTAPNPGTLPTSQGATLVYNSASSDASLLLLAQDPVQGQGLAGWTGADPTGTLTTIHHPAGVHKHVAMGNLTTQGPICQGTPGFYQFHYVTYTLGVTESGSNGAPLFNSSWQVVGQLFGACAVQAPGCNNPTQWNAVFGKFSRTLPQVCGFLTGTYSPSRVYVNGAATGAGTGLSWADAYPSLQTALTAACPPPGGMEIWVAGGTYRPGPVGGDRESTFLLHSGVRVYGGFAGTETLLSQRNIAANPTVLSGDLNGNDAPNFANRGDNAYHVVRGTGVNSTSVLDGFTIRGGNASGPATYNDKGGGMYVEAGSPKVARCRFEDNEADHGGGGIAYYIGSTADVELCVFSGNTSNYGGGIGLTTSGGAIATSVFTGNISSNDGAAIDAYESSITVTGCNFEQNDAGVRGGAVSLFATGLGSFIDCRMADNYAGYGGGAVHALASGISFTRCTVVKNQAAFFGGGVLHQSGSFTTAVNSRFLGNTGSREGAGIHANAGTLSLTNCEIVGNSTPDFGGGVWHNKGCQTTMVNCTVAANSSGTAAGGVGFEDGTASLVNCVLWGNTDPSGNGELAQLRVYASATSVNYSLIKGLTGSLGGVGNIGSDPLFVNLLGTDGMAGTDDDDLALGAGSPARDSGNNTPVQAVLVDLRGNARRQEDICIVNTGSGSAPIVDMGAIEGATCACYVNCDASTGVPALTSNDFQCFLDKFAAGDPYANCDASSGTPTLTSNDFQCFLNKFASGCS